LVAIGALADSVRVVNREQFFMNVSAAITQAFLPAQNGKIVSEELNIELQTNATLSVYAPYAEVKIAARGSTSSMSIYTTASNSVNGVALETGDFVLYNDSAIATKRAVILAIGAYADGATTYSITTVATNLAAGEKVWIADKNEAHSIAIKGGVKQLRLPYMFVGNKNLPVLLEVPAAAGNGSVYGTYALER
jgi:hypothetical protein